MQVRGFVRNWLFRGGMYVLTMDRVSLVTELKFAA